MKLRHAAALALVGWYLMVPPECHDPKRPSALIDVTAPLSQWPVRDEFDTAKECKSARDLLLEKAKRARSQRGWSDDKLSEILVLENGEADCIASDDPRLK